jgi:diaminopimelate decarboxylase
MAGPFHPTHPGGAVIDHIQDACRTAAERFGTPLYLYDLAQLRSDAGAVSAAFPNPWLRLYSLKANGLPALVRRLSELGFGASAVSGGELSLAAQAGFPLGLTALEGIGKTAADLRRAAHLSATGRPLLWLSLESPEEAAALAGIMGRSAVRQDVLVRINPGVHPETMRGLSVGLAASKFGVLPEDLGSVIQAGGGAQGPLRWRGIHIHIGSQLGAVDAWRSAFRLGLRLLALQRASLPDFDTLDAGSGFPVDYGVAGAVPSIGRFADEASAELAAVPVEARPARLAIEPGRAVVARSGWLVARVLHVRERDRSLVVLDAGMTELIRPALYGAEHPMVALTSLGRPVDAVQRAAHSPTARMRVDGPVCEATDTLGEARLPPLRRGDLVAVGVAGAYAASMRSAYNGRPRPPEVAWEDDALTLLRPRGRRV